MNTVEISLDGKPETLTCNLKAAKTVSALGGFSEVFARIAAFELNAYSIIVAAGLDKKPGEVEGAVYATGLTNLTEPLSEFVSMLATGGKKELKG